MRNEFFQSMAIKDRKGCGLGYMSLIDGQYVMQNNEGCKNSFPLYSICSILAESLS